MAEKTSCFMLGTVLGALVGATAALMLTSRTGNDIPVNVTELKNKTQQLTNSAIEKGSSLAKATKEKAESFTQKISNQTSEVSKKIQNNNIRVVNEQTPIKQEGNWTEELKRKLKEAEQAFSEAENKVNANNQTNDKL